MSELSLTWPWALVGLLVVPVLVVGYRRVLRVQEARRLALAARRSRAAGAAAVGGGGTWVRRCSSRRWRCSCCR